MLNALELKFQIGFEINSYFSKVVEIAITIARFINDPRLLNPTLSYFNDCEFSFNLIWVCLN